jgi:septum formation protein
MTHDGRLVLASSSPYRRELFKRLGMAFDARNPEIDESPMPGEEPRALARRLARQKASAVAETEREALVVGSDQVAVLGERLLGKPGTVENARAQLRQARGQLVKFITGLCVVQYTSGFQQDDVVEFGVQFRNYSDAEINRYVETDRPLDCAGSFRSEGLGIALVERMIGDDPTALVGLPLIRLSDMLRAAGWEIP